MIRQTCLALCICVLLVSVSFAGDLYRVRVIDQSQAQRLRTLPVEPVVSLSDGYLLYVESGQTPSLTSSGLQIELIASGIDREKLAIDNRQDRASVDRARLVFEDGQVRIFEAESIPVDKVDQTPMLRRIGHNEVAVSMIDVTRHSIATSVASLRVAGVPLDSLVASISEDSLRSYVLHLQTLPPRLAGSAANATIRDWLQSKLIGFGYDSTVIDSFTYGSRACQNVLAYKVGTMHPNRYVVVGAHRDAVSISPGADDNGSGTAGVLEIARALADRQTYLTVVFALFDCEEYGLYGSQHYVDEAKARGDSIIYMLDLDMIGNYQNTDSANVFYGPLTGLSNLWIHLADSLEGIKGRMAGQSASSDHYPFTAAGYEASFIAERTFSGVYHTVHDSAVYMSFPYMTRLVKASLATAYSVNVSAGYTSCCVGQTGDVNLVGTVDLSDLTALISYLIGSGYDLPCVEEADINVSGLVDLTDLTALVSYLTGAGYELPSCP